MRCFSFLIILITTWVATGDVARTTGNMNDYIDKVLQNLKENREYISKIEPLVVGTAVDESKFRVTDVVVRGLSSIGRRGDVTLTNDEANKKVVLNANLGVSGVTASGRYRYRQNRFIKLKGSLKARVNDIAVQIILSAPLNGGQVTLVSAKVTRFEGFKITKVSGASFLFNWVLKYAANKIAKKSKDKIVSGMESSLQRYLKDALGKVTFPGSV